MKSLFLCALLFLCLSFSQAKAQDSFTHDLELGGFDTCVPLVGDKILDSLPNGHDAWPMAQGICATGYTWYRLAENTPQAYRELLTIDLPCVGLSALIELLFPPVKGN